MIERQIIIGLITSSEFLRQIKTAWNIRYISSKAARRIASWCWDYFDTYNEAPMANIEGIFYSKAEKLPKDIAEEIEQDILPGLSEEYETQEINLQYLLDETRQYFQKRHLQIHKEEIEGLLISGEILEAEKLASTYSPIRSESSTDIDLSDPEVLNRVKNAFEESLQSVIKYPGALGEFWNDQLVKGRLVAFVGIEKRGKTFWLLDLALRASRQGKRVAFFQAGDMTEEEQLQRIGCYITQKTDLEKYAGKTHQPIRDCIFNQSDQCDREERTCDHGLWDITEPKQLRKTITIEELKEAYKENPDYRPCTNCKQYETNYWGIPYIKEVPECKVLSSQEAIQAFEDWFISPKRQMRMSTHPNNTLSVENIKNILAGWEKQDGFIPDLIVIDYADLLVPGVRIEFRHQQNHIWKGLRSLSQEKGKPLVITATQADADAYDKNRITMKNFSEDKRKNAHVTAMYGLNQDTKDREKGLKLMRINEIVVRKGGFSSFNEVTVLQNLERGRPFLGAYL